MVGVTKFCPVKSMGPPLGPVYQRYTEPTPAPEAESVTGPGSQRDAPIPVGTNAVLSSDTCTCGSVDTQPVAELVATSWKLVLAVMVPVVKKSVSPLPDCAAPTLVAAGSNCS